MPFTEVEKPTRQALVHVYVDEMDLFQQMVGPRGISPRIRELIREDLIRNGVQVHVPATTR